VIAKSAAVLYRCDYCGGLARWHIDAHGDPWYICTDNCSGFAQYDLLSGEPAGVPGVDVFRERDDSSEYLRDLPIESSGVIDPDDDLPF